MFASLDHGLWILWATVAYYTKHRSQGSTILKGYLLGDKRWFALCPTTLFLWSLRLKVSLLHLKSWSFGPIKMATMIIYMCFIIIQVKSVEPRFLKLLTFSIPFEAPTFWIRLFNTKPPFERDKTMGASS